MQCRATEAGSLLHDTIKGTMMGKAIRGRKRMHLLSDLMKGKYVVLKRIAEDRKLHLFNGLFSRTTWVS